jgi:hypothetical protein
LKSTAAAIGDTKKNMASEAGYPATDDQLAMSAIGGHPVSSIRVLRSSRGGRHHSLSVTQDLASLAEMIHGDSNRRRLNNMMSFLDEVGKRSASDEEIWRRPDLDLDDQ